MTGKGRFTILAAAAAGSGLAAAATSLAQPAHVPERVQYTTAAACCQALQRRMSDVAWTPAPNAGVYRVRFRVAVNTSGWTKIGCAAGDVVAVAVAPYGGATVVGAGLQVVRTDGARIVLRCHVLDGGIQAQVVGAVIHAKPVRPLRMVAH